MFIDPIYILYALPGLILSLLATGYVKLTFSKYSQKATRSMLTGAEAAQRMLERANVFDVTITSVGGFLSDHYDPSCKTLRLSNEVYNGSSMASIGVACHEAGHALQHANGYAWLGLRSALVPVVSLTSNFTYLIFLVGTLLQMSSLYYVGCICFMVAVVFSIVTLPVEWNASARAKKAMAQAGFLTEEERRGAASVLNAAFLTYVASAVSSLLTLLYYLMRARGMSRRR